MPRGQPWAKNYRMYSYLGDELPALIAQEFPADMDRQGVFGHSMGGHGALTFALKNPDRFRSCSAFAPIVNPSDADWSASAFAAYLGEDRRTWRAHDACALVEDGARFSEFLIDQGTADGFLDDGLRPWRFEKGVRGCGHSADAQDAGRLRPLLFLHLDLHGRPSALARRAPGLAAPLWLDADQGRAFPSG